VTRGERQIVGVTRLRLRACIASVTRFALRACIVFPIGVGPFCGEPSAFFAKASMEESKRLLQAVISNPEAALLRLVFVFHRRSSRVCPGIR